jgi:hypothetical protein
MGTAGAEELYERHWRERALPARREPFEGFDFTGFWNDSDYALNQYVGAPATDWAVADAERELGYKLPAAYIWLMKRHNGGVPARTEFPAEIPTSWDDHCVAIAGIYGIGRDKQYSLCGPLGSRHL